MCGIVGFLSKNVCFSPDLIKSLINSISHRGPDANDFYICPKTNLHLGHARLSIRDLTSAGSQPMVSFSKRYTIVYNGEIYNTSELLNNLQPRINFQLKGNSDTEVLLEHIAEFGLTTTLSKINGMYAFCLYDSHDQLLYLVRDRLGIKPLYYYSLGDTFLFSSELKSFCRFPEINLKLSESSTYSYFLNNYIIGENSIYENVLRLMPGHYLKYKIRDATKSIQQYWELSSFRRTQTRKSFDEIIDHTHSLLQDSVKLRMVSDRPVGSFLSGGIDSSLITSLMCKYATKQFDTFTIGSNDSSVDETREASLIANHLGTNHNEINISDIPLKELVQSIPNIFDEPFADCSQLASILISKFAKEKVSVVMSGDGGDELFYGYDRYNHCHYLNKFRSFPYSIVLNLSKILNIFPDKVTGTIIKSVFKSLGYSINNPNRNLNKLLKISSLKSSNEIYRFIIQDSFFADYSNDKFAKSFTNCEVNFGNIRLSEYMENYDITNYLPDNNLYKVDRSTMNFGLEARVPLIDYRVVEFAMSIPHELKFFKNSNKIILKTILKKYLPSSMVDLPKKGFSIPLNNLLIDDLGMWVDEILNSDSDVFDYILDKKKVYKLWCDHKSRRANNDFIIWKITLFLLWYDRFSAE